MKTVLTFLIINCCFQNTSQSQNLQEIIDLFQTVMDKVPSSIHKKVACDELINICDEVQKDIDYVLRYEDEIADKDIEILKKVKRDAALMNRFIRTIGNTSFGTGFMTEKQLNKARDLIDFDMLEIYTNKFCIKIFKIRIGNYFCILGFNPPGNDTYKIEAICKSRDRRTTFNSEMGLPPNNYRQIWNSEDVEDNILVIANVKCSAYSSRQIILNSD